MLISNQKKDENIVEYVLYMWQLEDILRSLKFEEESVQMALVEAMNAPENIRVMAKEWYMDMCSKMQKEGVAEKGHISDVREVLAELEMLHQTLIGLLNNKNYQEEYGAIKTYLEEAQSKMAGFMGGETEAALNIMYGILTMKLKKTEISPATKEATSKIAAWLGLLAGHYKKMKSGDWNDMGSN